MPVHAGSLQAKTVASRPAVRNEQTGALGHWMMPLPGRVFMSGVWQALSSQEQ
jgi:hypothetical protein